ncbi:hypothetical protein COLO4_00594, partial [Corchorus olitorius]
AMWRTVYHWGTAGAASRPFRHTGPLLQGNAIACRSGLVSRKGRKAAPAISAFTRGPAQLAINPHRHFTGQGHPPHHPRLGAVVIHRIMLRGAVIPDRHIPRLPAPAHGVLQLRHMPLQHREQVLRVRQRIAFDALDEVPQLQCTFTTDRVYPHHRVLGLVDGRGEHLAITFKLGRVDIGLDARVVIFVAVHRPQLVGQLAQRLGQFLVGRRRVGPDGIASGSRRHHAAQDRGLGVGIDEGYVGVPGVGPLAFGTVQLQQVAGAVHHWHGGVGDRLAEQLGKAFLAKVVEVGLATEEDHLVLHQGSLDGIDSGGIEVGGQLQPTDFGADAAGNRVNVEFEVVWHGGQCGIAHGRGPCGHGRVWVQRAACTACWCCSAASRKRGSIHSENLEATADQALAGGQ